MAHKPEQYTRPNGPHLTVGEVDLETGWVGRPDSGLRVISDRCAQTIASWWHSASRHDRNITGLSHRTSYDPDGLVTEVQREADANPHDRELPYLLAWALHFRREDDN